MSRRSRVGKGGHGVPEVIPGARGAALIVLIGLIVAAVVAVVA